MPLELDEKINLFIEFLNNGGINRINHIDLLKSLKQVKWDYTSGKVIPETLNSLVKAAVNAYTSSQLIEPYVSDTHMSSYETLLQKTLFFDTKRIDTWDEFLLFFNKYSEKVDYLFRGINEANFRLYSSLQRYWIINKLVEKDIKYENFVFQLIKIAREDLDIKKQIEGFVDSDLAILSILQHYGTPTPLLDWTYSFPNALLFSLQGVNQRIGDRRDIENYFSVYYIPEENYKDGNVKLMLDEAIEVNLPLIKSIFGETLNLTAESLDKFIKNFDDKLAHKLALKIYATGIQVELTRINKLFGFDILYFSDYDESQNFNFGLNNNPNILEQKGVFTWNNNPTKPIEHMINISMVQNEIMKNPNQLCYCWDINKDLSDRVSVYLKEKGYTYDKLFPESINSYMIRICNQVFDKTIKEMDRE